MSEDESNGEEKEMSAKQNRIRRRAVRDEDEESSDDTILTNPMKALFSNKELCDAESTDSDKEPSTGSLRKSRKKHRQKKTSENGSNGNLPASKSSEKHENFCKSPLKKAYLKFLDEKLKKSSA